MKITKLQLIQIIKEELQEHGGRPHDPTVPGDYERYRDNPTGDAPLGAVDDDGWSTDPIELLEEIISEVQIDAGAYDEPRRSRRSNREESDRIRAQTAGEYLDPLNKLMELLKSNSEGA